MSERVICEESAESSRSAFQAWLQLAPGSQEPSEVTVLKKTSNCTVYRLHGVGPGQSAVVAKHSDDKTGHLESLIYNDILGRLPMASLHCYGFIKENGGNEGWLFLEDAGTSPLVCQKHSLSVPVCRWLGMLHTMAAGFERSVLLPRRGPAYYLDRLRFVQEGVREGLGRVAPLLEERAMLERLLRLCELLARNWSQVESLSEGLPSTLVHCDFQPKNVLVRETTLGSSLLVVDWEYAGWGPPASDLGDIDAVAYWAAVRQAWPQTQLDAVRRQRLCGVIFSRVMASSWEISRLVWGSVEKAVRRLSRYEASLGVSARAAGWET